MDSVDFHFNIKSYLGNDVSNRWAVGQIYQTIQD